MFAQRALRGRPSLCPGRIVAYPARRWPVRGWRSEATSRKPACVGASHQRAPPWIEVYTCLLLPRDSAPEDCGQPLTGNHVYALKLKTAFKMWLLKTMKTLPFLEKTTNQCHLCSQQRISGVIRAKACFGVRGLNIYCLMPCAFIQGTRVSEFDAIRMTQVTRPTRKARVK